MDELHRVLKPGGQLLMFECVGSGIGPLAMLMDLMTPLTAPLGPESNRDTVGNVQKAGFVSAVSRTPISTWSNRSRLGSKSPSSELLHPAPSEGGGPPSPSANSSRTLLAKYHSVFSGALPQGLVGKVVALPPPCLESCGQILYVCVFMRRREDRLGSSPVHA